MNNLDDLKSFPSGSTGDSVMHVEPAPCPRCGDPSERVTVTLFGQTKTFTGMCAGCSEAAKRQKTEQEQIEQEHRLQARWQELCPPRFRQTDRNRLPAELLRQVMDWEFGQTGLVLYGPTGACKTRVAWLLMERLLREGRTIAAYDDVTFSNDCSRLYYEGEGPVWFQALCDVDVLFLDDLGKASLTPRVESTLWGVVDRRINYMKPIIATTNLVGEEFTTAMSNNRGPSLIRRLREFCHFISAPRWNRD